MQKYKFLLIVFLLLLPVAYSQESMEINLIKSDYTKVSDVVVLIKSEDTTITKYVAPQETLTVPANLKDKKVTFVIDDEKTLGKDYSATVDELKKSVVVTPVGSVRGIVKDKFDNVVSFADLQFECPVNYDFPNTANKFGSFFLDAIPVGSCRVFGGFEGHLGFQDIVINQGDLVDIELNLDKSIISTKDNSSYFPLVLAVTFILGVFVAIVFLLAGNVSRFKRKSSDQKRQDYVPKKELGQRGKDIYNTLRDREKEIVDFLLSQSGHTVQSKIHKELGIAKSSLFRIIESLEAKKVISTQKTLKARRIKLSDWFLEEE